MNLNKNMRQKKNLNLIQFFLRKLPKQFQNEIGRLKPQETFEIRFTKPRDSFTYLYNRHTFIIIGWLFESEKKLDVKVC